MDRQIVYPGQIPLETDLLNAQKNAMIGLAKLAESILGTNTLVDGLACTPTSPASMTVDVAPGQIFELENIDDSAYGALASDTTHQILKQGVALDKANLSCPAPGTAGYSINYLIQATYQSTDGGSTVLPYYNASNPAQAYSGPNNNGTAQYTVREGKLVVSAKPGVAATTGSQTTPSPDSGYVGLFVITVADTDSTLTAGNISQVSGAPFITEYLTDKISQATADTLYSKITAPAPVRGMFQNLVASTTGLDSNIGITIDELTVESAANEYQTLRNVNVTIDSATVGANGLDAGSLAVDTWYYTYIIWDGTTVAGLISASPTAPTLPSGYTHWARVGAIHTDTTANKYPYPIHQVGRRAAYAPAAGTNMTSLPTVASGNNAGAMTSIANLIPVQVAKIANVYGYITIGSSSAVISVGQSAQNVLFTVNSGGTSPAHGNTFDVIIDTDSLWYAASGSGSKSASIAGWEDNL